MRARRPRNLTSSFNMDSPYVTEVRRLLQSLLRKGDRADRKTYLVTSADRGEGKSTACTLLAVVAARVFKKRVLVIDGDFRRPTMHRLLELPHRPGLVEVLQGLLPVDAVIRSTAHPNLFAIPSGSIHGAMTEAYNDDEFGRLLRQLREDFDLIFVDSAPAVPVVEPLLMAEHLDAMLVVTMAGRTPLNIVRRMRQILAPVSSRIAGIILNNATEGLPYYYDYHYYGYETSPRRRIRVRRHEGGHPAPDSAKPGHHEH
jgi:capsular exopolysaccharide synthesis family protein